MSMYTKIISEQLVRLKRPDVDPRHVEAYMRCQHGTLDRLDRRAFNREVKIAVGCVGLDARAGRLASSHGSRR